MSDARLRRARESDQPVIVGRVDDWWGRRVHPQLPRLWFQHFASTSFVAEGDDGRPIGFVVGFVSQDRPDEAFLHLVGVSPGRRRRGLGRALVGAFAEEARARGARRMTAITWPGDPIAVAFMRSIGFEVDEGPGTQRLYGTPSRTNWNREEDDQVLFSRVL
jgi:GNAT superfamily N-acetyltransferase